MKRFIFLVLFASACGPKSANDVAAAVDLQVSDGFRFRGGVAITSRYAVSDLDLLRSVDVAQFADKAGEHFEGAVEQRSKDLNLALVQVASRSLTAPRLGDSALLKDGDIVTAQFFDAKGTPHIVTGKFAGWRYHLGRAYFGTSLETPDDAVATGVFAPDGSLVGVQAIKRGANLTLVLPIEYVVNGNQSLGGVAIHAHSDTKQFSTIRAEAQKHPGPLPDPVRYDELTFQQSFSRTALVGQLIMLDKKDAPAHAQPVHYKVEAVDGERHRRVIGEGVIDKKNLQWAASPESTAALAKSMTEAFGEKWVEANVMPYDFGVLRYRVPFAPFCPKVTDREVHALTLSLADGRKTSDIGFSDLVNICAGQEDGDGTAMEKAWGMASAPGKPPPGRSARGRGRR